MSQKPQSSVKLHCIGQIGQTAIVFVCILLYLGTARAGTVAHYRFEDGTNDTKIVTLTDSGPNAIHGTPAAVGAPSYSSEVAAYPEAGHLALVKFRTSAGGVVPHHESFDLHEAFTVEFLFRMLGPDHDDPSAHERRVLLSKNLSPETGSPAAWHISYRPCTKEVFARVLFQGQPDATLHGSLAAYPEGAWHHLALVFQRQGDSGCLNLYINGQVSSAMAVKSYTKVMFGIGPMFIGGCDPANTEGLRYDFSGLLDEVRVSDAALRPAEFVVDFSRKPLVAVIVPKVEISWPSRVDTLYRVEWCSQLNTNDWFELEGSQAYGQGFSNIVYDALGAHEKRFYRIVVVE